MSTSKKAAPHRKAIAEAAQLAPIAQKPGAPSKSATMNPKMSKSIEVGGNSDNNGSGSGDVVEDYETAKVNKSKKAQYEADIRMVQDLDRWG